MLGWTSASDTGMNNNAWLDLVLLGDASLSNSIPPSAFNSIPPSKQLLHHPPSHIVVSTFFSPFPLHLVHTSCQLGFLPDWH